MPPSAARMTGLLRSPSSPRTRRALAAQLTALLTALLLCCAPCAAADERADRAAAQKLQIEGSHAMTGADYPRALARYQEAYARFPNPRLLLDLAGALRALGRNAEAAASYEAYLREPRAERGRTAEITRALAEIDALVGRLRIQVSGGPATVRLDGKALDGFASGATVRVDPGEHTVTATRDGAAPASATLRIASGEQSAVSLALTALPPAPVIVVPAVPPVPGRAQRTAALVVGGAGVAGLVGGVVAGSLALVAKGHLRGHCFPGTLRCDQAGVDLARSGRTLATFSTAALSAGAGLVGTGVLLFFTAPSPPPTAVASGTLRFALGAGRGGPAATVEGAW